VEKEKNKTAPIVCATRGGKTCQSTQGEAIFLAQERGAELFFLFVADPSFAGPIDEALRNALVDELARLGRWILHLAQRRASNEGLEAQVVVRHGTVRECIVDYIQQINAGTLVIGSPRLGSERQEFTTDELNRFASDIQQATGAEVVIAA
jgi:nucleotide-binding universal stress UspA family protein